MTKTNSIPRTFAEVEGFIDMLRAACDDRDMHATLERILSLPDQVRKQLLHTLLDDLRMKKAPQALIDAFVCMLNDDAAEKAYSVIFQCER